MARHDLTNVTLNNVSIPTDDLLDQVGIRDMVIASAFRDAGEFLDEMIDLVSEEWIRDNLCPFQADDGGCRADLANRLLLLSCRLAEIGARAKESA